MFSLYKCPAGSDSRSNASPNWKFGAAPWQISRRENTTHLGFCIYFPFGTFPRFLRPDFQLLFLNFFWKPPPWTWKALQRWHQSRKTLYQWTKTYKQKKKMFFRFLQTFLRFCSTWLSTSISSSSSVWKSSSSSSSFFSPSRFSSAGFFTVNMVAVRTWHKCARK